ncbi:class I SAM-dependent methyltransferase [Corynebacterium sp. sy039]|uniref:class I SAM-dependent methyltransferase n=1 Tax=Corynebacterium sp. sy039 TaxID=2599641 RepID=UPI0011B4E7E3|nr:class I SAM-dependent methyltransferase [Corynebacterium sp. sy039]QDZ42570.1 class I SAM-dependent methyltransferase [Corynebacterium sp. sy039]
MTFPFDSSTVTLTAPPISRKDQPKFHNEHQRKRSAQAFNHNSDLYDDIRPGYREELLDLLPRTPQKVIDLGCGTGKLSSLLASRDHDVIGIDPSMDMLRVFSRKMAMPCIQATAENTALRDHSVDVITCAQTWHWVDSSLASAECDRISTSNARLVLAWNSLDVTIPWVHRLSRIMHAGDTLKEGFYPHVETPWSLAQELRLRWNHNVVPEDIEKLVQTRSYWLRSNEHTRAKVMHNLQWYLYDHLQYEKGKSIQLPYRFDCFLYRKQ